MIQRLNPEGILCLGHSEGIPARRLGLANLGHTLYSKPVKLLDEVAINPKKIDLILIGASTGGTEVLSQMLAHLPAWTPPIVIVQHITEGFAKSFAERLAQVSGLQLAAIENAPLLEPGHLALAQGDYHLLLKKEGPSFRVLSSQSPRVNGHRPSVDALFQSASQHNASQILALLLTGMGSDGAEGLLKLKEAHAITITQSAESCVVYGMPRAAMQKQASLKSADPAEIRQLILDIARAHDPNS